MSEREIVGRGEALDVIDPFLDRLATGGAALVFEGAPGIGKTTVWRAAAARATARGITVLTCRAVETEAKLAFAALGDLLEPLADAVLSHLPEPQRLALAVALLRTNAEGEPPSPRAVATAVRSALQHLATSTPVLMAIDDQQWLDSASSAALAFALRRLGAAPVGVVSSARIESDAAHDPLALDAAFADRLTRCRLGPLSAGALHHVIRGHLGHVFPRPTLRRIADASGGNPFYALELARAFHEARGTPLADDILPVPDTLASLMAQRLERLPPRVRGVLLLVAAAAAPTVEVLRRAAGRRTTDEALRRATDARVVEVCDGRVRFLHPLLAAAAQASATATARRTANARLAVTVTTPEERARHRALATAQPDADVASALDDAARLARQRGAPEAAAELQEQAARLTPRDDASGRRRRWIAAAHHLCHVGNLNRARRLLDVVLADAPTAEERATALHILARIRGHEDSYAEARDHLVTALAQCREPRERIEIAIDLAFATFSLGEVMPAVTLLHEALGDAERAGAEDLVARLLAMLVVAELGAGLGGDRRRLDRALAGEDRTRGGLLMLCPTVLAGVLACYEGRIAEGDALLGEMCAWATERGEESGLGLLLAHRSWLAWWRGDLGAAVRHADDLMVLGQQANSVVGQGIALMHRSRALVTGGELTAAASDLAHARTLLEQVSYPNALMLLRVTEATHALWLGDAERTLEILAPLLPFIAQSGFADGMLVYACCDAVEASVRAGVLPQASAWLAALMQRIPNLERPWATAAALRCRSLLAAAGDDLDTALADAEEAARRWEPLEMPVEHARALLTLGQLHRRRGERRAAHDVLERAEAICRAHGAHLWADRARDERGRIPIRRLAGGDLTATEARVAALAAEGHTNRHVARALFMSPKTVEANLARVYRKLGIRSRAELGAHMGRPSRRER